MNNLYFVSAAGVVFNEEGDILMLKSPKRGWEFPGGVVEDGETIEEALKREIKEETGVEVEVAGFVGLCKNLQKNIVNIDFYCKYKEGNLTTSDESMDVRWVTPKKAQLMVENELIKKRLENMLKQDGKVHYFSFSKDPFRIREEVDYEITRKE